MSKQEEVDFYAPRMQSDPPSGSWPLTEIKAEYVMCVWHCCHKPREPDSSYCADHIKLAAKEREELKAMQATNQKSKTT